MRTKDQNLSGEETGKIVPSGSSKNSANAEVRVKQPGPEFYQKLAVCNRTESSSHTEEVVVRRAATVDWELVVVGKEVTAGSDRAVTEQRGER